MIPPMLLEAVRIALEVWERKLAGRSLARLDAVEGFGWAVNEASP